MTPCLKIWGSLTNLESELFISIFNFMILWNLIHQDIKITMFLFAHS